MLNNPAAPSCTDKLVENADTANNHLIRQPAQIAVTDDTIQTLSVYAKALERPEFLMRYLGQDGTFRFAWFDLVSGVVGTTSNATSRAEDPEPWTQTRS